MNIKPFKVEEWMNAWEDGAVWNIAETCVDSVSLDELFALTGEDKNAFLNDFSARRLTYGEIVGREEFRAGVASLFQTFQADEIITTHGAAGANHHIFYSLIEPGDKVISVMPTYQQLYSIPESYGAEVRILKLRRENGFLPDLDELRKLAEGGVKLICINNPNNPSGALMPPEMLNEIVAIARKADAWLLCDEVYRHLTQTDDYSPSVADLYEKGISVGSMSKVFSLAGLRLGWIATHDESIRRSCLSHRDYNMISCGMLDEAIAAVALRHKEALLARNRGIVRDNLALLDAWVQNESKVSYVKPAAGTTALIDYAPRMLSNPFCEGLYKATGALVTPGECFDEEYCFRIGYACDTETLRGGLKALSEYLKQL